MPSTVCQYIELLINVTKWTMLRILLVDDHTLFRESIVTVLEELESKIIVYQAASITEAKSLIKYYKNLELIIFDITYPDGQLWDSFPFNTPKINKAPILILTGSNDLQNLRRSMATGCKGYITKFSDKQQLLIGIKAILNGDTYVSADILSKIENNGDLTVKQATQKPSQLDQLSNRQLQILKLLTKGYSNKNIAIHCQISEGTVKLHVSTILKILGVSNRTQAVIKVNELNLL